MNTAYSYHLFYIIPNYKHVCTCQQSTLLSLSPFDYCLEFSNIFDSCRIYSVTWSHFYFWPWYYRNNSGPFQTSNSHVPNSMQMSKSYCLSQFALNSAHEKFDVWNGPQWLLCTAVTIQLTEINIITRSTIFAVTRDATRGKEKHWESKIGGRGGWCSNKQNRVRQVADCEHALFIHFLQYGWRAIDLASRPVNVNRTKLFWNEAEPDLKNGVSEKALHVLLPA